MYNSLQKAEVQVTQHDTTPTIGLEWQLALWQVITAVPTGSTGKLMDCWTLPEKLKWHTLINYAYYTTYHKKCENILMELAVDDDKFAILEVNLYKHNHS